MRPQTSDEFDETTLAPMWEWNHNPDDAHWSLTERPGFLRLHAMYAADLLHARNTLTETMQDRSLEVTVRMELRRLRGEDRVGLTMFDKNQSYLAVEQKDGAKRLVFSDRGSDRDGPVVAGDAVQLRVRVNGDV